MASGANSSYSFHECESANNAVTGATEEYTSGLLYGWSFSRVYDYAQGHWWDHDCTSSGCGAYTYTGEYGITPYYNDGVSAFVGTAISAVPLPAGFPLLIAGLGAFALLRRKIA